MAYAIIRRKLTFMVGEFVQNLFLNLKYTFNKGHLLSFSRYMTIVMLNFVSGSWEEVILCKGLVRISDPVVLSLLNFVFSPNSLSLFSISCTERYSLASHFSKRKNRIQPINIEPPTKQLRIQNK